MEAIFERTKTITPAPSSFCPGCMHAISARIIAESIDELGRHDDVISVMPIGCACLQMFHIDTQIVMSAHGRAAAVATGIKRSAPDHLVFSYQGDGDLAAIGTAETIHAANRGENITVIMMNNSTYGMTGGQLSPTTLVGQKATTAGPGGRNPDDVGYPMHMCEILNQLKAPAFIARVALDSPAHVNQAKAAIKKAFEIQLSRGGYCFIEIMCNCPTNWGMTPVDTLKFMREKTMVEFPIGVIRDTEVTN